jgi:hypothetical protein
MNIIDWPTGNYKWPDGGHGTCDFQFYPQVHFYLDTSGQLSYANVGPHDDISITIFSREQLIGGQGKCHLNNLMVNICGWADRQGQNTGTGNNFQSHSPILKIFILLYYF